MKPVIKAKGRFFRGLVISPVLISTDSNPPKAKTSKSTDVENEENSKDCSGESEPGLILNSPMIINKVRGSNLAMVRILFTLVESFTPIWFIKVKKLVNPIMQTILKPGWLKAVEKKER